MEAAGLAIGIAGLAGLFTTCQSVVDKFSSYQNFDSESRSLEVEYNAHKARFERWGQASGISSVGIDNESSTELLDHGTRRDQDPRSTLENPHTQDALTDVLQAIIDELNSLMPKAAFARPMASQMSEKASDSKRSRLGWAVSKKKARTENIARFRRLVDALYSLVPLSGPSRHAPSAEDDIVLVQDLRTVLQEMRKERHTMTVRDVHAWLVGSGFPNERFQESTRKRLEGTCSWIFEDDTFQNWRSADTAATGPKIMWIHGPAGFGKTILSARIVEELIQSSEKPVAQFFYSSGLEGCDDPFVAARSWISQIAARNENALDLVRQRQLLDVNPTAGQTTIMDVLCQTISLIPGCTLIADGLDECAHMDGDETSVSRFLRWLLESVADTETRLLFVSRDEPAIRSELEDAPVLQELRISPGHVRTDTIALSRDLIKHKLSNKNEAVRSEISTMLSDQCRGQFLWLKLQAGRLRGGMPESQLHKTIETTPPGLDQAYDRIWQRIEGEDEDDRDRVLRILRWAAFSRRPLTIGELAEAALINEETGVLLAEAHPGKITEIFVDTEIVRLCGMFIDVTGRSTTLRPSKWTVQLSHFTVRHFLLRKLPTYHRLIGSISFQDLEAVQHTQLAKSCLHAVMTFRHTANRLRADSCLPRFARYALKEWLDHYKLGSQTNEGLACLASKFFDAEFLIWNAVAMLPSSPAKEKPLPLELLPLEFAMEAELESISLSLINSQRFDLSGESARRRLPHLAYAKGMEAVVNTMVQLGADLSVPNAAGWTPLHCAASFGTLTPGLLAYPGQDIDLQSHSGYTPLHLASLQGHGHVVQLLLENGAQVDVCDSDGWTSLIAASSEGHHEVVQQLLDANADVEHESLTEETALMAASRAGHHKVVQQLLDADADLEQEAPFGLTPLGCACINGHSETLRVLLHRGAHVNRVNLVQALSSGVIQVFEMLLDEGGLANSFDAYETALNSACDLGNLEAVALLLSRSKEAYPNAVFSDEAKELCLRFAAKSGNLEIVRLLFQSQFSVQAQPEPRWTALHEAVRQGNLDMVELLLQQSFEGIIRLKNNRGSTSLHLAARLGKYEIVKFLIDYETKIGTPLKDTVDVPCVELKNNAGDSAISSAIKSGDVPTIRLLFQSGCTLPTDNHYVFVRMLVGIACSVNDLGFSELSLERIRAAASPGDISLRVAISAPYSLLCYDQTCMSGNTYMLKVLLEHGVLSTEELSEAGSKLLCVGAFFGHTAIVQTLLSIPGIEADQAKLYGKRPLYLASQGGETDVVEALLSSGRVDVDAPDSYGSTAVWAAFRNGHYDAAKLLLPFSTLSADSHDHHGRTLLWWARRSGSSNLVQLLSDHDVRFESLSELDDLVEVTDCPFDTKVDCCDVCGLMTRGTSGFNCDTCEDFIMCVHCGKLGFWCLDVTHTLRFWYTVSSECHIDSGSGDKEAGSGEEAGPGEIKENIVEFEYYLLLEHLV